jgi:hypothetical protein
MINSDLISFLENSDAITSFERKKKIYELTNNLDIDLLEDLRKEVINYYKYKFEERLNRHKEEFGYFTEKEFEDGATADFSYFINTPNFSINEFIDDFLNHNEYKWIEDIIDKTSEFTYDLEELIKRSMKLSKNIEISKINAIEETIDFSDTSITSKIIFLEKLGIIEFLRNQQPFISSVNSMASAISAVTGGKASTIQSMVNPMINNGIDNKNNPMNSLKTVSVVENKLINIGFKPKK